MCFIQIRVFTNYVKSGFLREKEQLFDIVHSYCVKALIRKIYLSLTELLS